MWAFTTQVACLMVAMIMGINMRLVWASGMIVPQASRFTYRLDFGVPLDGTGFMVTVSGETNQAVPMTAQEDVISPDATSIGGLVNQP